MAELYQGFITKRVNMIVLESEESLKLVLSSLNTVGYTTKMLKPLLFCISWGNYHETLIYCSKIPHDVVVSHLNSKQENPESENIRKINQQLNAIPTFPSESSITANILIRDPSVFSEIRNGKVSIVVSSSNFKKISQRVINFLINVSERPKYEVYILHEGKISDFKNCLPTNHKDKVLVLDSAGEIFASLEKNSNIFDSLKFKK
jgi:hypothetical protein